MSFEIYLSLRFVVLRILRDDGICGFYVGLGLILVGMFFYSICYYFMYDIMKIIYCKFKNKKVLSCLEMFFFGVLVGK